MQDLSISGSRAYELLSTHAKSPAMQRVLAQVQRCAQVNWPVLLRGETGTGKEVVAQALHQLRAPTRPLVTLNCGAISQQLAESELFGHRRGAFTGATQHHKGAFERAKQGTVFLDEIGELALELQPKLLRVLENGQFLPVGASQELQSQAGVIAATHRPLQDWITRGRFREDLYHRLALLSIELVPLRQRRQDIPGLLAHFASLAQAQLGRPIEICASAIPWARSQPWPGNLRQMRNLVLRAALLCGDEISKDSLIEAQGAPLPPAETEPLQITRADFATMKRQLLKDALRRQGNLRLAANELGVPKSTLATWLKKSGTSTASLAPDQSR